MLLATIKAFAAKDPDTMHLVWGCADVYAALLSEIQDDLPEELRDALYRQRPARPPGIQDELLPACAKSTAFRTRKRSPVTPARFGEGLSEADLSEGVRGLFVSCHREARYERDVLGTSVRGHEEGLYRRFPGGGAAYFGLIFGAGYPDEVLLQDMVVGEDCNMNVLTAYCDRNCKVKLICFGREGPRRAHAHGARHLRAPSSRSPIPELQELDQELPREDRIHRLRQF